MFRRPQIIFNGEWSTTGVAGDVLTSFNVADQVTSVAYPIWADKIKGFNLVRGTAVVRVQINANPFQAGRLILHYLPCDKHISTGTKYMRNLNLTTITQQPHVVLDCRDAECVLRIPYVTPTEWYNIAEGFFDWGTPVLRILSPLRTGSGGNTTVDVKVWLHFEDFEVSGPIFPQSNYARSNKKSVLMDDEAFKLSPGPKARTFKAVSKAAGILSEIPLISAVAGPVSIVMDSISGLAAAFGWSKPNNEATPTQMVRRDVQCFASANGTSNAVPLSLCTTAKVAALPGFAGSDFDEMSFAYLKQIPAQVSSFLWNVTDSYDNLLYSKKLTLSTSSTMFGSVQAVGAAAKTIFSFIPAVYVANRFTYWRGQTRLHFKFIKTDYHTGRLVITYNLRDANVNSNNSQYVYRDIIDLRESSDFCFTIPYIRGESWSCPTDILGRVELTVLNELRAPETASQTIEVLCWASAGESFDVAVPAGGPRTNSSNFMPIQPQSAMETLNSKSLLAMKPIGGHIPDPPNLEHRQFTIGDTFSSVKQMMTRYTRLLFPGVDSSSKLGISFYPYATTLPSVNKSTGVISEPVYTGDDICYFSSMYAFNRGSIRLFFQSSGFPSNAFARTVNSGYVTYNTTATNLCTVADNNSLNFAADGSSTWVSYGNASVCIPFLNNVAMPEVLIPPFGRTHSRLTNIYVNGDTTTRDISEPPINVQFRKIDTQVGNDIYRAAGDDFQCGFFVGCPPLYAF